MIKLFIYGTLSSPVVQQKIIGRISSATSDILKGYKRGNISINYSIYPIAIKDSNETIMGNVIEVTAEELKLIDEYETSAYSRVSLKLASTVETWVYIKS